MSVEIMITGKQELYEKWVMNTKAKCGGQIKYVSTGLAILQLLPHPRPLLWQTGGIVADNYYRGHQE